MKLVPKAFDVIADTIESVPTVDAKTILARELVAYSIGALATLEGAWRAADEVQAMADKVRFT
jgi:hypothetical protein